MTLIELLFLAAAPTIMLYWLVEALYDLFTKGNDE